MEAALSLGPLPEETSEGDADVRALLSPEVIGALANIAASLAVVAKQLGASGE